MFGFGKKESETKSGPAGEAILEDGTAVTIAQRVDCIGDSCPRPQLMTKKALSSAGSGDVIEVLVDNPSSVEAIPPMLHGLGATLLETRKTERRWEIYLRKN
ncbi:MAG: sulfurtransferase TusA family protein [Gammaproteobacteria bacterium]|nr:sulfurtransferase TusA family protein [Gammaproteobacteria bacterium]MCB1860544.1 sulfurtransferase TusA family protein [Gammaproteobacteria bacterium]MCB1870489.1 sulfurtransferase TusA family protein [Gammaproteobacteria bacterium]MCB1879295.1 sulfurtransferase TusA family protein [Gammaproteobacteria bacterium]MCB1903921.1 sulfurtransferase TusA family protein [Gammaproteobacteria bacterium]